jgi:signal transduction histidine kinase
VFDLFDPEISAAREIKKQELIQKKQPIQWEDQREGRFYRNRMYPILGEYNEVESIAIFASDITEHKQTEDELRRHVEELRHLNIITSKIASSTDVTTALLHASEMITDLFQARYSHVIYASAREQNLEIMSGYDTQTGPIEPFPIGYQLDQLPQAKIVMEKGQAIIIDNLDSLAVEAEVQSFLIENQIKCVMLAPLFIKGIVIGVISVSGDMARAAFNEHELSLLEAIASYIAAAIENARLAYDNIEVAAVEERSRLARDLHDAVTQTIYAASLIVESLPQVWARNPDEGQRNLIKLRQLVRGALAEMRSLLFELRPSSLETASMDTLIQFIADAFTGRTRVPVTMKVEDYGEVPAEVKIAFYRITQEVFNNITKHAEATTVKIDLEGSTKCVALTIQDSGIGFDPRGDDLTGMGLSIMRERAAEVGAQLEIESQMGQGTKVTLNWMEPNQENLNE